MRREAARAPACRCCCLPLEFTTRRRLRLQEVNNYLRAAIAANEVSQRALALTAEAIAGNQARRQRLRPLFGAA